MPKNLPGHWEGQWNGSRWGCPMAPAGQIGWWLIATPPPSPPTPAKVQYLKGAPGAPSSLQG